MKEVELRKWHRILGILVSLFIIIQAGSGLILSFIENEPSQAYGHSEYQKEDETEAGSSIDELLELIHTGGGGVGVIYRLVVGVGLLLMVGSGVWIFVKVQLRQKTRIKS